MSDRTFDWFRILLLALAVAGLLVSGQIVNKSEGGKLASYMEWTCGGQFSCDKVLASPFAKVIQLPPYQVPVSTAAVGMAYFMVLGIWLLLVGRLPGRLHHAWVIPSLIGLGGLLATAAMIYVMGWVLKTWCGLCLLTHAIDLLLVLGIWRLWSAGGKAAPAEEPPLASPPAESPAGSPFWKIPAMALLVAMAIGLAQLRSAQTSEAVGMVSLAQIEYDQVTNDDQYRKFLFDKARKVEIPIDAADPTSGPVDARHTLVIFGDFQCPHCAEFASLVPNIQKSLGDPMRVVFKYFPLSSKCNPGRPAIKGPDFFEAGCTAAAAAEAARQMGGNDTFWKAHETLFKGHDRLQTTHYNVLAESLGLDPQAFDRLRNDPAVMNHVREVAAEGAKVGVLTTPAIFLDGRRIEAPWKNTFDRQKRKRVVDLPSDHYVLEEPAGMVQPGRRIATIGRQPDDRRHPSRPGQTPTTGDHRPRPVGRRALFPWSSKRSGLASRCPIGRLPGVRGGSGGVG